MPQSAEAHLEETPLNALHVSRGAKMVPFAGYSMPLQYETGILAEHRHTRTKAGLFDVSHMGQIRIVGADPAAALEALVPGDLRSLPTGGMRYTMFTNQTGGILDDLIVTRRQTGLHVVVNAATAARDLAHLNDKLGPAVTIEFLAERALLALQGPLAAAVLGRHTGAVEGMTFMTARTATIAGVSCELSRSGYTGEDGFEISVSDERALDIAEMLLAEDEVLPIGLGARDSLRLEAGLCLYGHDIDESTTPVEAGLAWSIARRRREEGGFPGFDVISRQLAEGAPRRRVGIRPTGRVPAREGADIVDMSGRAIGHVTSGGFGPTVEAPVAMGYVSSEFAAAGTEIGLMVRGKRLPASVAKLPFVPQRYAR